MITDEEFLRISVFMKQRYGIDLSQKKVIVNGRLENYIKSNGWHNFNEFMDAVMRDVTGNQEKMLVNFLTTNHTYFMREFEHFEKGKRHKGFADLVRRCFHRRRAVYDSHGADGFLRTGKEPVGHESTGNRYFDKGTETGDGRYLCG